PRPPAPPEAPELPKAPPANCVESGRVTVRLDEVGADGPSTKLQLGSGVGDYLLITPPTGGSRPAAAVVRLDGDDGVPRVALVRPVEGAPPTVDARGLAGAPLVAELENAGRRFRLEVSASR
ncbi:MAG: hypothetical protein AAGM22_17450, partial [Acidobacteriota bacterium]